MHTHIPFTRAAFIRMAHLIGFGALCIAGSFLVGVQSAGDTRAMLSETVAAGDEPAQFPYGQLPDGVSQAHESSNSVDARQAALIASQFAR